MDGKKKSNRLKDLTQSISNVIMIVITQLLYQLNIYPENVFQERSFHNISIFDPKASSLKGIMIRLDYLTQLKNSIEMHLEKNNLESLVLNFKNQDNLIVSFRIINDTQYEFQKLNDFPESFAQINIFKKTIHDFNEQILRYKKNNEERLKIFVYDEDNNNFDVFMNLHHEIDANGQKDLSNNWISSKKIQYDGDRIGRIDMGEIQIFFEMN